MCKPAAGFGLIQRRSAGLALAALLALPLSGNAAAQGVSEESGNWQFELAPYLWAARLNGDIKAVPLPEINVDMKFSDILETLDFGFMTTFEARKGRWGFHFDGMHMKNSDSVKAGNSGLSAKAELELKQTQLAGAVAYRALEGDIALDVMGGLRYMRIDADARINGSLYGLSASVRRSGDKDWLDPYVGMRAFYPIGGKWTAVGYADIGGFNVGSDFTWQASLGLEYAYSKTVSAKFGYRYLKVDYDKDGFRYDMANDGLYAGAGFHF